MPEGGEVSFYLQPGFDRPREQRWLVVRLSVGQDIVWDMLPNPTAARSTISPQALEDLTRRGLLPAGRQTRVLLRELRIDGQPILDVEVSMSPAIGRLGVDGILGLDFFEQFDAIHWYPRTRQVVLIGP